MADPSSALAAAAAYWLQPPPLLGFRGEDDELDGDEDVPPEDEVPLLYSLASDSFFSS